MLFHLNTRFLEHINCSGKILGVFPTEKNILWQSTTQFIHPGSEEGNLLALWILKGDVLECLLKKKNKIWVKSMQIQKEMPEPA